MSRRFEHLRVGASLYKFTGKESDLEVGLTYFGARYYSPQLGRWISPDPLAIHAAKADLNPYAYVQGQVSTSVDPLGLDPETDNDVDAIVQQEFEDDANLLEAQILANVTNPNSTAFLDNYMASQPPVPDSTFPDFGDVRDWAGVGLDFAINFANVTWQTSSLHQAYVDYNSPAGQEFQDKVGQVIMVVQTLEMLTGGPPLGPQLAPAGGGMAPPGAGAAPPTTLAPPVWLVGNGTSGGPRAGKGFTAKGKAEIDAANAAENDGVNKCTNCQQEVVPGQRSEEGVRPPDNERQRDHIIPKSQGGDGDPSNGQVLCRLCNLWKSDK